MHQATVEKNHGTRRAGGADDAALFATCAFDQLRNQIVVNRPKGVTGGGQVMLGINHTFFVAAWNEHQWAVEFIDIV